MTDGILEINTRVWLHAIAPQATLDDVPDAALDGWDRCAWVWLLGVWTTGEVGRAMSRRLLPELRQDSPEITDADIGGSCFAITDYTVSPALGGPEALARFRARLAARGVRLMLDFVPNHMAPDHPWIHDHPERFMPGQPGNTIWIDTHGGPQPFAHGKDPYFPGWADTVQLNYGRPDTQQAMQDVLLSIAHQCDGVRCDMAQLLLPDVFQGTWGVSMAPFWEAALRQVRVQLPLFHAMAEVYWGRDAELRAQGFDWTYDKDLYDAIRRADAGWIRGHLHDPDLPRMVHFLENHDEPRAASVWTPDTTLAAMALTYGLPGIAFTHQGQEEGRRVFLSVHRTSPAPDAGDPAIRALHARFRPWLDAARTGGFQPIEPEPAWDGNPSHGAFVVWAWAGRLIAVNLAPHDSQCRIPWPWPDAPVVQMQDAAQRGTYIRHAADGLTLALGPWGVHLLTITKGS